MGLVAAVFKLMPESAGDLGQIKEQIKANFQVQDMKEVPVGFGIKMLEVMIIFDDKKGIGNIEEELAAIEGIASIESGDATLI
ncbi:MAG TPA: elongation factor 1-beta [archaeon]|nr:elongation factor 1-beta [archaeon]